MYDKIIYRHTVEMYVGEAGESPLIGRMLFIKKSDVDTRDEFHELYVESAIKHFPKHVTNYNSLGVLQYSAARKGFILEECAIFNNKRLSIAERMGICH